MSGFKTLNDRKEVKFQEPSEMMWGILHLYIYIHIIYNYHDSLGCPPSQDATTRRTFHWLGDPEPNLHLPLLLGRGTTQITAPKVWNSCKLLSYFTFECEGGWVAFGPYACLGQDCSKDAGNTHTHKLQQTLIFPWVSEGQESTVYLDIHMLFVVFCKNCTSVC